MILRLLACALACLPALARGADAHFLTFENDIFFGTDRYYTNGVQLTRLASGGATPAWTRAPCRWLGCEGDALLQTQHDLGQLMYTPRHIAVAQAQPDDRPWAGLLYVDGSASFRSSDQLTLTTLTWEAGVTGPASMAEQTQKFIHHLFGVQQPRGWSHQIGPMLGLMASAERRHALPGLARDWDGGLQLRVAAYWRAALGDIMSYAAGGATLTVGHDLPPVSLAPGGIVNRLETREPRLRWTAFGGIELRAMAWNVFLQGRPWMRDDPHVPPRRLVGDAMAGIRLDRGRWCAQFKATRRSPEFHGAVSQSVGALSVGTQF